MSEIPGNIVDLNPPQTKFNLRPAIFGGVIAIIIIIILVVIKKRRGFPLPVAS